MTNEERDIISQFIARVGGAPAQSGFAASVPATQAPPLPPVDREADTLIGQMFQRYPEAPYRMTQLAFVQEQGLVQAQSRIQQLEAQLAQARQAAQQAQQQPQQGGGGFFSNLFGGGGRQQSAPPPNPGPWGGQAGAPPGYPQQGYAPPPQYAPPPPQYAPGYQPGMFQRGGSGFLGSALTTAAGVAGGMVAGNLLTNMLTGGHHTGGGSWGGDQSGGGAWGGGAAAPGVTDQGTWDSGGAAAPSNQDYVDNGTWDQPPAQDASWTDSSSDSGGGTWDSGGGGGGSSDDTF